MGNLWRCWAARAGAKARCCALWGLLQPTAGRVLLDGVPVTGPGPERTMVFQNFDQLLPWYTLRGNIEWALRRTGAEPDRGKGRAAGKGNAGENRAFRI